MNDLDVEDIFIKARSQLLLKNPFFGYLVMNLDIMECPPELDFFKTACTDGKTIFYNKEYVLNLYEIDKNLVKSLFMHEVMHCVLSHVGNVYNYAGKNHTILNIAMDYVVNNIIKKEGLPLGKGWYQDDKYDNMHTMEIYDLLLKDMMQGFSFSGSLADEHDESTMQRIPGYQKVDSDKLKEFWDKNIIKADNIDKDASDKHGAIKMALDSIKKPPKILWHEYIKTEVSNLIKSDFNWNKPNKKYFSHGFYLPSIDKKNRINIGVAIDTSGSISNEDVLDFMTEVNGIISMFDEYTIHAAYFDSSIHTPSLIENSADFNQFLSNVEGGGGTSFEAWWDWIEEDNKLAECNYVIFFTDGLPNGRWIPNYIDYDNIYWVVNGTTNKGPVGTTLFYESN